MTLAYVKLRQRDSYRRLSPQPLQVQSCTVSLLYILALGQRLGLYVLLSGGSILALHIPHC